MEEGIRLRLTQDSVLYRTDSLSPRQTSTGVWRSHVRGIPAIQRALTQSIGHRRRLEPMVRYYIDRMTDVQE